MTYILPTDSALKFKFGPWQCAMWAQEDQSGLGLGEFLLVGHGDDDVGYT